MRRKFTRCRDGYCGAEDCPRCHPGCDRPVACDVCGAETAEAYQADDRFEKCDVCGKLLCPDCQTSAFDLTLCPECYKYEDETRSSGAEIEFDAAY